MNKSLAFAYFGALLKCVLLQSNDSDAISGQHSPDVTPPIEYSNVTKDSEIEVRLLVPQLPVLNDGQLEINDSVITEEFGLIADPSAGVSDVLPYGDVKSSQCYVVPNTSRAATFLETVLGFNNFVSHFDNGDENELEIHVTTRVKKITCVPRNSSDLSDPPLVKIVNSSELLQQLGSRNSTNGRCTVVLFYAPWCIFSAQVAPHYNALARAFPKLDVVAINAFHFSNLNSRFGTIAVPNVMIFHSAKAIARFNGSERTLESLTFFVSNVTGMQANFSVEVTEEDYIGPLQSEPTEEMDYLLLLSWLFVILCCIMGAVRSSAGVRVWNTLVAMGHHEQNHHQHID